MFIVFAVVMKYIYCVGRRINSLNGHMGFSLLEFISVLVIISILAAVVFSHTVDHSIELIGEAEVVKGHLRYAQTRAMNSNQSCGVSFSGSFYTLLENGMTSDTALPGESGAVRNLALGTISSTINPVVFNHWGNPGNTAITITINDGSGTQSIYITPFTGFIP